MKIINDKCRLSVLSALYLLFFGGLIVLSCNKTFPGADNELRKEYPNDTAAVSADNKRVLYLIIDGARGSEVDTLKPTNLTELTKNALFTWHAVSGTNLQDTSIAGAWVTMLTGVNSAKHKVINDFTTADFMQYPDVITRLKMMQPKINVSSFSSSAAFSNWLMKNADKAQTFDNNDEAVANGLINELKANDSIRLLVGQFSNVTKAGDSYGYSYRKPQYADAINKIDTYIGNVMNALHSRKNFKNEDWLVIISSNANGNIDYNTGDSLSAYDDTRKNSFVILHNPRFKSKFIPYPTSTKGLSVFQDSTLLLQGLGSEGVNVSVPNEKNILDMKKGSAMSVEFKIKFLKASVPSGNAFTNFVGNINPNSGSDEAGWALKFDVYQGRNNFLFYANNNTVQFDSKTKNIMSDNKWHTITFIMDWTANENGFYLTTFVDGEINVANVKVAPENTTLGKGLPLLIGPHSGGWASASTTDMFITDIRVWDIALPIEAARQYACRTEISSNSPYIKNLIMDYKLTQGKVKDFSIYNRPDGTVQDPGKRASWQSFADISNAVCPVPDHNFYKSTVNGIDIPIHIYQWLGIVPVSSWGIESIYWPDVYNDVVLPDNY